MDDYAAAVIQHVTGDWSGHTVAKVSSALYVSNGQGITNSTQTLRVALMLGGAIHPVLLPATPVGAYSSPVAPIIALQPQSQSVAVGSSYRLTVYAVSHSQLFYQWYLNAAAIPGANTNALLITSAAAPSNGVLSYTVLVTNADGTALSNPAVVTVVG